MARMIAEVYDAFRSAGADEDKARAAATAVADTDREMADLRGEMAGLKREMAETRGDVRLLKWMVGVGIATTLGLYALVWQVMLRLPAP